MTPACARTHGRTVHLKRSTTPTPIEINFLLVSLLLLFTRAPPSEAGRARARTRPPPRARAPRPAAVNEPRRSDCSGMACGARIHRHSPSPVTCNHASNSDQNIANVYRCIEKINVSKAFLIHGSDRGGGAGRTPRPRAARNAGRQPTGSHRRKHPLPLVMYH
ncbi:hypothetical protein EVAR_96074_1 [Eumeta japonica]|uniref:Uncharacterized protein n=1 Tax=Eumeta variegata TaxID=151549 RepID=A0A4C1WAE5_EUMVA|nr:hypothetical protein EVAR_96074_1 [Eumeta japonica]